MLVIVIFHEHSVIINWCHEFHDFLKKSAVIFALPNRDFCLAVEMSNMKNSWPSTIH